MKKIAFWLVVIVLLFYINSCVHAIYDLWQKQTLLTLAQHELSVQQREHAILQKQRTIVTDPAFIESEARNKLFLIRPGEKKVIIPQGLLQSGAGEPQKPKIVSNWQAWWNMFF